MSTKTREVFSCILGKNKGKTGRIQANRASERLRGYAGARFFAFMGRISPKTLVYFCLFFTDAKNYEKRVYVGNRDILLAHMKTGLSISEINERLAAGATIDANGSIIDPVPVVEEPVVTPTEDPASVEPSDTPVESAAPASAEIQPSPSPTPAPNQETTSPTETTMPAQEDGAQAQNKSNTAVIIAIAAVLVGAGGVAGRKLLRKKEETKK